MFNSQSIRNTNDCSDGWTEVSHRRRRQAPSAARYQWDPQQSKAIADCIARNDTLELSSRPDETKVLSIDPASYQSRILVILQSLVDNVTDAASAAPSMLSLTSLEMKRQEDMNA